MNKTTRLETRALSTSRSLSRCLWMLIGSCVPLVPPCAILRRLALSGALRARLWRAVPSQALSCRPVPSRPDNWYVKRLCRLAVSCLLQLSLDAKRASEILDRPISLRCAARRDPKRRALP